MNNIILSIQNISKRYMLNPQKSQNVFWALKDISFNVHFGERVAITGDNGSGKSTLLKIISRVTSPTLGKINGFGRVISLLEVGAGFHPDLNAIQNIYLNGAMHGMTKKEIQKEADDIISFAELTMPLNQPVKKYSSGEYVRLAFSVAAHLKSEILIADEILAVGDQKFQEKCLNKLFDLSTSAGRTILMVSHNKDHRKFLCNREIELSNGEMI